MRTNGTLQYQTLTEAHIDENGEAVAAQSVWSDAIRVSIKTNNDNRKGAYEDGEFRVASFTVLLEADARQAFDSIKRVRLMRGAELLGEFRVLSGEPILSQGRYQIIV